MPIRMIHVEHGATHAYSEEEVVELGKIGWQREVRPAQTADRPVQKTETLTLRRRGRPRKEVANNEVI